MQGQIVRQTNLGLAAARSLLETAVRAAEERGLRISAAVTDRAGLLLGFLRMDGASLVTIEVAMGKARSAALLGAPSALFEGMINTGETAMVTVPQILPLQGGVPIVVDGEVCGAIGISGSTGDNDRRLAEDVAAAFGSQVK